MLNRIRRAVSPTRARYFPKGRHRRPLTLSRPRPASTSSMPADESTIVPSRASDWVSHRYALTGEENALVRPYVLAWERRTPQCPPIVYASHLPTEAWSALLGAC